LFHLVTAESVGMAYEPFGDLTAITYSMPQAAGDMQTTITRDSRYRMQRLETGPGLIDRSYGYGFTGNIASIATNTADSLPEPQITSGVEQYGYTTGTNKLSDIDLLSGMGENRSYTYDNNGNTLSDGTRTFTWNQDNRLTSVASAGAVAQYVYNGKGQRVKKVAGWTTTIYHYDLQGNLIETTYEDGSLIADFVYAGDP
jgi:YD repeat-containing protein